MSVGQGVGTHTFSYTVGGSANWHNIFNQGIPFLANDATGVLIQVHGYMRNNSHRVKKQVTKTLCTTQMSFKRKLIII